MFKTVFRDTQRQFRDYKLKAWSESSLSTKTQSVAERFMCWKNGKEEAETYGGLLNLVPEMDTTHHEL